MEPSTSRGWSSSRACRSPLPAWPWRSTSAAASTLPFSIAFWVNPAAKQKPGAGLCGNMGGFERGTVLGLCVAQDGDRTNCISASYGNNRHEGRQSTPAVQLTADEWQHVVACFDGAECVIFVDGVEKGRAAAKGAVDFAPHPDAPFRLGHPGLQQRFFKGLLSDSASTARPCLRPKCRAS